jgi:hypothetical protein
MYSFGTTPPTMSLIEQEKPSATLGLRLHLDDDVAVLAATARLAHELAFLLDVALRMVSR